jgi:NADPH-dependent curcumin reductase CurA
VLDQLNLAAPDGLDICFENEVSDHFQVGRLKSLETVVDGIDQAVAAFIDLFDGKNVGKMVVKLSM